MEHPEALNPDKLKAGPAWNAKALALALVATTIAVAAFFLSPDKARFWQSYLIGFCLVALISIGALGFVMLQHVGRAGWSTTVRRLAEGYMMNLLPLVLLFIPVAVLLCKGQLFPWANPDGQWGLSTIGQADSVANRDVLMHIVQHAQHSTDAADLRQKGNYYTTGFFLLRSGIYLVVCAALAFFLFKWSTAQDATQDKAGQARLTKRMEGLSAPGLILAGFALTFASFDWIMSQHYTWYSTIFGVIHIADALLAGCCVILLTSSFLKARGLFDGAFTVEHRHELSKWIFAFNFFWGFVALAQFLICWYADIPEETDWYNNRSENGWEFIAWLMVFGHFLVPFVVLLSRHAKRHAFTSNLMALWLLIMVGVHLHWEIMPGLVYPIPSTLTFALSDVLVPLALVLFSISTFMMNLAGRHIVPARDPRLHEGQNFENY